MITEAGALSCDVDDEPSFGRGPFGHDICSSVNDAVLHGLPYVAADAAISFIVGNADPPESVAMISATESRPGCCGRSWRRSHATPNRFVLRSVSRT